MWFIVSRKKETQVQAKQRKADLRRLRRVDPWLVCNIGPWQVECDTGAVCRALWRSGNGRGREALEEKKVRGGLYRSKAYKVSWGEERYTLFGPDGLRSP